ncbi:hypothetical protein LZK98_04825 [Sphingomonas cannabina]|nr:hypothetical protein [Sphingomonas cannabina]UIJ46274.1 hypothetical protein LZK98_04825 [Sphingomonas cannabina]
MALLILGCTYAGVLLGWPLLRWLGTRDLVSWQVVEHHDVPRPERWREDVLGVGAESIPIHRAIKHPGRRPASEAQAGDEGHRLPVTEWRAVATALADGRPSIAPGHLGAHPGLIEATQAIGVDERLCRPPQSASCGNVGSILLGRAQGFF